MAHAESLDVVDRGQAEVQLQRLLPVLPFDLHRHGDGVAFTLLQLCQVGQQAGAVFGAAAPQQTHAAAHQQDQRAVVAARSLEGPRRLPCDRRADLLGQSN